MNLANIRKEKGMTQEALAQSCGISRQRITNYEIGIREPNLEILKRLASALDCSVDDLLADENDLLSCPGGLYPAGTVPNLETEMR